nr:dockerin type I domain-containing protein [uncultured Desulfobacter sp.]
MIKEKSKFKKSLLALPILIFLMCGSAFAQVSVYAEGAYTDTDLVVYIYADISTSSENEALLSYGVTLEYNPVNLGNPVATKNSADWYFGDKDDPYPTPNAEPDTNTAGKVIIVGGKLDSSPPIEGVSGDRVLLATVTFDRLTTELPSAELYLGKGDAYANFVQINGTDLDQTLAGTEENGTIGQVNIFQRGDANGDGVVNVNDLRALRIALSDPDAAPCYVDCNGDGVVNVNDLRCIKLSL